MGGGPESFHLFFEVVLDFRRTPSTIEQLEPSASEDCEGVGQPQSSAPARGAQALTRELDRLHEAFTIT
jgi:hypothetical protein